MKDYQYPDITVMETEEAIRIIRKPDEKTIKKEILPPVFVKTKPEIIIEKNNVIEKKLYLPPSKCDLTLNERFTTILCHIQKKEIDPEYRQLRCPNTLIGRLQRCRMAARSSAAPYTNPRQSNLSIPKPRRGLDKVKDQEVHLNPASFEMVEEPKPHVPGEPLSTFFHNIQYKSTYCTGPSKSKEELDEEIEQYFKALGGRGKRTFRNKTMANESENSNRNLNCDSFDLDDRIGNIKINTDDGPEAQEEVEEVEEEEEPNLFKTFVKAIKTKGFIKQEKVDLDQELDDYFGTRRKQKTLTESLDDDLEDYKRQDPRNRKSSNKNKQSVAANLTINDPDDEFSEFLDETI